MIHVFESQEKVAQAAADLFLETAVKSVSTHGRFLVALSGGSTPAALFSLLSKRPYLEQVPWRQTHVFWSDERLVPPQEDGSNYKQAFELLLRHTAIPEANIHRAKGELPPAKAVRAYQTQLQKITQSESSFPAFDLILLGMGRDGHTASLFPGPISTAELSKPLIQVTADYDGRPAQRLTFTPLLINKAHTVLLLVTGKNKAQTIFELLHNNIDLEKWPVQRVQPSSGNLYWYLDHEAAQFLEHSQFNNPKRND